MQELYGKYAQTEGMGDVLYDDELSDVMKDLTGGI